MADDERRAEIEAVERRLQEAYGYTTRACAESVIAALDRVRDARGDDGCPKCGKPSVSPPAEVYCVDCATEGWEQDAAAHRAARSPQGVGTQDVLARGTLAQWQATGDGCYLDNADADTLRAMVRLLTRGDEPGPAYTYGHRDVQVGVTDDAMPIERCERCGRQRIGVYPEDPCPGAWSPQGEDHDLKDEYHEEHQGEGREFDERCGVCRPELKVPPQGEDHEAGIEAAARAEYERSISEPYTPGYGALPAFDDVPDDRKAAQALGQYGDVSWNRKQNARRDARRWAAYLSCVSPSRDGTVAVEALRAIRTFAGEGPHTRMGEACGIDACIGCLIYATADGALAECSGSSSDRPEQPEPDALGGQNASGG